MSMEPSKESTYTHQILQLVGTVGPIGTPETTRAQRAGDQTLFRVQNAQYIIDAVRECDNVQKQSIPVDSFPNTLDRRFTFTT